MAYPSHRSGSGDGKAGVAYRPLTTQLPILKSRPVVFLDVGEGDAVPGT